MIRLLLVHDAMNIILFLMSIFLMELNEYSDSTLAVFLMIPSTKVKTFSYLIAANNQHPKYLYKKIGRLLFVRSLFE